MDQPQSPRRRDQSTTRSWEVGDRILDRYEILDIRPGGMGVVYVVGDYEWNKLFAIKTFQDRFLWNKDVIDRFTKEAETWVNLERHTNIVFASFVREIEGKPYIFLEYINGGDLSQYIGKLDISHAIDFAIQLCNGMDYACKKLGVIHRDIKPQNLLITSDGVLKVTDFGLVKAVGQMVLEEELNREVPLVSCGMGTWPYMPPEQFPEKIQKRYRFPLTQVTTRSDIYSFGVALYEVLTGRLPFSGIEQVFTQYAVSPASLNPKVPRQLDLLLLKCLERNPYDRQKSFADLLVDLIAMYDALPVAAKVFGDKYVVKGRNEPLTASDWGNKGAALHALGKHQDAIACCDRALGLEPRCAELWTNKGIALNDLRKYREAIACYDRALELNPRLAGVWNNKGNTLASLGRYSEAIACYDRALELDPRLALAWRNKGDALGSMKRHQEAIACYDRALELNPRDFVAWNNKGVTMRALGEHQGTINCCDRALELNPKYFLAWYNKGVALGKLGRNQEATVWLRKFIEFAPPQDAIHVMLAEKQLRLLQKEN